MGQTLSLQSTEARVYVLANMLAPPRPGGQDAVRRGLSPGLATVPTHESTEPTGQSFKSPCRVISRYPCTARGRRPRFRRTMCYSARFLSLSSSRRCGGRRAGTHGRSLFSAFVIKDDIEVDLVLERGTHEGAGVEVKAAATVTTADFRGMKKSASAAGTRFVGGVVLYDARRPPAWATGCTRGRSAELWRRHERKKVTIPNVRSATYAPTVRSMGRCATPCKIFHDEETIEKNSGDG